MLAMMRAHCICFVMDMLAEQKSTVPHTQVQAKAQDSCSAVSLECNYMQCACLLNAQLDYNDCGMQAGSQNLS